MSVTISINCWCYYLFEHLRILNNIRSARKKAQRLSRVPILTTEEGQRLDFGDATAGWILNHFNLLQLSCAPEDSDLPLTGRWGELTPGRLVAAGP